jgi:hypothetical protein
VIDWTVPERKRTTTTMFPAPRSYSHCSVNWHGTKVLANGSGTTFSVPA